MIWQSVVLNRRPTDDELAQATAHLFSLPATGVLVVDDLAAIRGSLDDAVAVICERSRLAGPFDTQITFILRDAEIAARALRLDTISSLTCFCEGLDADCFLDDPDNHPYSAILVSRREGVQRVLLDADRLDDAGEYAIQPVSVAG